MPKKHYQVSPLPGQTDFYNKKVFNQLVKASRALAELKGEAKTIPNEHILLSTLGLQEAKDSSAVENIITTNDELFRAEMDTTYSNPATKEVQNYVEALLTGYEEVKKHGLLTNRTILTIQKALEKNNAGFRKLPGTNLKNQTGQIIYEPPQDPQRIIELMSNLEAYINGSLEEDVDPLIKMAIIHFQFESIHPFYDGNGRTGRIINILYLVKEGLLDIPVLYLSQYIIQTKSEYYRLLQAVREEDLWEEWILYILKGVELTAYRTVSLIKEIRQLMQYYKKEIRTNTNFYRKELLENLFQHPYTKIAFIEKVLDVHRNTAASYLNQLVELELLDKIRLGKSNYYVNRALFNLLKQGFDAS